MPRFLVLIAGALLVLFSFHITGLWSFRETDRIVPDSAILSYFQKPETFSTFSIKGFANSRIPDGIECDQLLVEQSLEVTNSMYIDDDMLEIATDIVHPMLDYSGQSKGQSFTAMVDKTWSRMSGSSVWLKRYGVFLTVTRVFFYDKGVKHWPVINFLRAQLHDADWNHLYNYTLDWQGQQLVFPRTFEIDAPYKTGGAFYGPEDPRIILESDLDDAEPIVIFNMMESVETLRRSMHAFRPFSNFTTTFFIENRTPNNAEKNWSPFFMPREFEAHVNRHDQIYPHRYIHFVYDFHPLKILRCHLLNGACTFVYEQPMPEAYKKAHEHGDTKGVMRGGTNFEPLPMSLQSRHGLTSYIGFPRTHTDAGCGKKAALYRPELMVLTTNGTVYWIDYTSEPLSFGTSIFPPALSADPCVKGRILLANSIAQIHDDKYGKNKDVMTLTFTVDDSTVQVAKIRGLQSLVKGLPQYQSGLFPGWDASHIEWNQNVTSDSLICSIVAASNWAISMDKEVPEVKDP